jgi:hypothetical protein
MSERQTRCPSRAMTQLAHSEGRPVEIDGMNVVFHEVVELSPVPLEDEPGPGPGATPKKRKRSNGEA